MRPESNASTGGYPVIEIYPLSKGVLQPDNTTRLGFTVEYLDRLVEHLRNKGVKIISEPSKNEWGYSAVVQDHDGRKIELTKSNIAS